MSGVRQTELAANGFAPTLNRHCHFRIVLEHVPQLLWLLTLPGVKMGIRTQHLPLQGTEVPYPLQPILWDLPFLPIVQYGIPCVPFGEVICSRPKPCLERRLTLLLRRLRRHALLLLRRLLCRKLLLFRRLLHRHRSRTMLLLLRSEPDTTMATGTLYYVLCCVVVPCLVW